MNMEDIRKEWEDNNLYRSMPINEPAFDEYRNIVADWWLSKLSDYKSRLVTEVAELLLNPANDELARAHNYPIREIIKIINEEK